MSISLQIIHQQHNTHYRIWCYTETSAWSNHRGLTDKWVGVRSELCNVIFLHAREERSPSGTICWKRMGRLDNNATVIAAAQATHLLLMSALCHYSETNCSGCHVEAKQCRMELVFDEKYSAVFIVHVLLMWYWNLKNSPRCAVFIFTAEWCDELQRFWNI